MIPRYENAKPEKISGYNKFTLPAGGYVGKIKGARVESNDYGSNLIIAYDVTEGEYAGCFEKDFNENPYDTKKWRGTLRLRIPQAGNPNDYNIRSFNNFIGCLEESNSDYHWDWDESKLKGKQLGFVVRNKEYSINGYSGWTTEAAGCASVEDIRNNTFKKLKDKPLKESTTSAVPLEEDDGGEPLPF